METCIYCNEKKEKSNISKHFNKCQVFKTFEGRTYSEIKTRLQSNMSNNYDKIKIENKMLKDKKCNTIPVNAVPRKVIDNFQKYSDSSDVTILDACICRSNFCNSARNLTGPDPYYLLSLLCCFILSTTSHVLS